MKINIVPRARQAQGAFNGGEIVENKPIGFPQDGGEVRPYSNLFYWARAVAVVDSTIGLHPHQGFEIMSFVLEGRIRHFDTKLNEWKPLAAGDAQIIRAGSGISHAEFMAMGAVMFQIWVDPDLSKTLGQPASYDDYPNEVFPRSEQDGIEVKTWVGEGSPFYLQAEGIRIFEWRMPPRSATEPLLPEGKMWSCYVIEGEGKVAGRPCHTDDFLIIESEAPVAFATERGARIFIIESPIRPSYPTYWERVMRRHARV